MTRRVLAVLLALPFLVACGGEEPSSGEPVPGDDLPRGEFVAIELPPPFEAGDRLQVRLNGGSLTFSATCNTMSATVTRVRDVLGAGRVGGTEMGCPGAGHGQDEWLVNFFTSGPRIKVLEDGFTLTAFGDTLSFLPPDAVPSEDVSLRGTQWRLTGIEDTDGDAIGFERMPSQVRATLQIEGDSITFHTGCNHGGGRVSVEGDLLRLRGVAVQLRGCLDGRAPLETRQVRVLMANRVDWSIEGQDLRLTRGDTTLVYRATRP